MFRRSRSRPSSHTPDDLLTVAIGAVPALAKYRRDDEDEPDQDPEEDLEADEDEEEWEEDEDEEYEEEDLDELDF
jgi:hypothetical protein